MLPVKPENGAPNEKTPPSEPTISRWPPRDITGWEASSGPHRASPVASTAVPAALPPTGDDNHADGEHNGGSPGVEDQARAARALREAFARLAPQGSDAWNFLAAFTHLGDRYGPYHPGASALSDALDVESRSGARRQGRLDRLRAGRDRQARAPEGNRTELEEAMGHVVEAFRFLSARVATLEARIAAQDRPVEGAAWLVPARELGDGVDPVAAHVLARTPGGEVVHADCGEGALLRACDAGGATAHGVEPRGALALRALERGCSVTIAEASEYLSGRDADSLGGIVLSGVVDRLSLHALLSLLAQSRRTLAHDAPLVVVSEPGAAAGAREPAAHARVDGRPLHAATWEMLLDRAGFVEVAPLPAGDGQDGRFALVAATPS